MNEFTKRKQVRVYLDKDDVDRFQRLVESVSQLSESTLLSLIVHAALESIDGHGGKFTLPLKFTVVDEKEVPLIPSARLR